jgi:hypothetical protein
MAVFFYLIYIRAVWPGRLVGKNEMQGNCGYRTTNQDEQLIETIFAKYFTVIKSNSFRAA